MKKNLFGLLALCFTTVLGVTSCGVKEVEVKKIDIALSSEQYAFGINKTNSNLLTDTNAFLSAKKTEIDAIFSKYMNASAEDLATYGFEYTSTSSNRANELVVATNLDFAPFEYTNGNKAAGIDMEIAALLATYLNKSLVIVNMDFDAVVTTIQNLDTCDIAMAGLTVTEDRKQQVNFTDAYYDSTQVIIAKKDDETFASCKTAEDIEEKLATLSNVKIGGQTGTTSQFYIEGNESLEFDGFANIEFKGYSSAALAIQDMKNGNINFVLVDEATADAIIKSL